MEVVETARTSVREGEGLAKPLRESKMFPPIVTHIIAIGERSGQLEEMLENVAKEYERQVDTRVQAMTSLLEPLIIMIMGGAVTTDAVLAQQYDARVKEIVGDINKIQETIVAGATAP